MRRLSTVGVILLLISLFVTACARRQPPPLLPPPPPPVATPPAVAAPSPPPPQPTTERIEEALPVPPEPLSEDAIANRSLDELNRDSPFRPVFFELDEAELDDVGRKTAQSNADLLKKYQSWVVTVEGHCDERGTAEYNLALGERRARATLDYLAAKGIQVNRMTIVSYGKERPLCQEQAEPCRAKNRRAQFLVKTQ
jgi:peptidoglycan-associated lipoprotein